MFGCGVTGSTALSAQARKRRIVEACGRVSVFGFRDSGLGSGISGLGFRDSGLGIRDSGFGSGVSNFDIRGSGFEVQVSGFGSRVYALLVPDRSHRVP